MTKTIFILLGILFILIVWFTLTLNLFAFALAMADALIITVLLIAKILTKIFN